MKFDSTINYSIISNKINSNLLNELRDYIIIDDTVSYNKLEEMIYNFPAKTICFNDCLRKFSGVEKNHIMDLLKKRKVNFINVTSNMDEVLFSDYIYVYYDEKLVIEGTTLDVLKEEKLLKRLGFNLPFVYNLSLQLKLYGILDKVVTLEEELVNTLWN